jgi:ribokinase
MSSPRVLVVGDTAFDHYLYVAPSAGADEKEALEAAIRTMGGTGANAAVVAATLGASVTLVTMLGDDPIGDWLHQELEASPIHDVRAQVYPGGSMIATIISQGDGRRVLVDPGGSRPLRLTEDIGLDGFDVTYVTFAPECAVEVVARRPAGLVVVGAEHWMFGDPGFSSGVLAADVVVTNEAGWAAWAPRAAIPTVVVTRGSRGATLYRPDASAAHFPAPAVTAVDATGAGDAFAGSLVASLGRGIPIEAAVERAVIAGAIATTRRGSRPAFQSDAELDPALWPSSGG